MKHRTLGKSSIEKALDILMAFTSGNQPMGTMELSQKLSLDPAMVNRIFQILASKDMRAIHPL
jgi:DNA-binding IclR family transcriptional regulator